MGLLPDNTPYTQTARSLFKWMPFLGDAETKVVFALYELTFGNGKPKGDKFHYSEIEEATGLSNPGVRKAVKSLAARGAIVYRSNPKNTRAPMPFKVVIDWVPTAILGIAVDDSDRDTKERGSGESHLNHDTKNRGHESDDRDTRERGTAIPGNALLNTKSKTKSKTSSPVGRRAKKVKLDDDFEFVPPTIEDVAEYMASVKKNRPADAEDEATAYMCHFVNNGWRTGKPPGSPMRDWKLAASNWLRPKPWMHSTARGSPNGVAGGGDGLQSRSDAFTEQIRKIRGEI